MKELIEKIADYHKQLEAGTMHASDLEPMLQCIRDLEEQVIVLRYKAFEMDTAETTAKLDSPVVPEKNKSKKAATPKKEEIQEPIALNFGGFVENSPEKTEEIKQEALTEELPLVNQTSLIDAIAERQENVSVNDRLGTDNTEHTLGDKLRKMPISDLRSAIGLNQKFWFINNLFNDDGSAYNTFIDRINTQENLAHAMKIVNDEIKEQFNWEEVEDKSVNKFLDFVERRFMEE